MSQCWETIFSVFCDLSFCLFIFSFLLLFGFVLFLKETSLNQQCKWRECALKIRYMHHCIGGTKRTRVRTFAQWSGVERACVKGTCLAHGGNAARHLHAGGCQWKDIARPSSCKRQQHRITWPLYGYTHSLSPSPSGVQLAWKVSSLIWWYTRSLKCSVMTLSIANVVCNDTVNDTLGSDPSRLAGN